MVKIRVIPYGIPDDVLESEPVLRNSSEKLIQLSRVPSMGELIIWQAQSFKITKVTHTVNSNYAAVLEIQWSESLPPLS